MYYIYIQFLGVLGQHSQVLQGSPNIRFDVATSGDASGSGSSSGASFGKHRVLRFHGFHRFHRFHGASTMEKNLGMGHLYGQDSNQKMGGFATIVIRHHKTMFKNGESTKKNCDSKKSVVFNCGFHRQSRVSNQYS